MVTLIPCSTSHQASVSPEGPAPIIVTCESDMMQRLSGEYHYHSAQVEKGLR